MIYDDDNVANEVKEIFVERPNPFVHTDEDSGDEIDKLKLINNLTGGQLQAGPQVKLYDNEHIGASDDDVNLYSGPQPPPYVAGLS